MREETRRRTPGQYTREDRTSALQVLNDKSKVVMPFTEACVLLDMATHTGYTLARKGLFPGALRIGDVWKVNREKLRSYLYDD